MEKHPETETPKIKCVVWDLDNTVWDGILAENDTLVLRKEAVKTIEILDQRGILQSIASRNDYDTAMEKLENFALSPYFLYPQISWGPKSEAVKAISVALNIGIDTLAFVDDQTFERESVQFYHPEVLCIDAADVAKIPNMARMNPRFITEDSRIRREMYQNDIRRNTVEKHFSGSQDEFLATLEMRFTIAPADADSLKRAEELTVRTHQLNTTGYTYSYDELNQFRLSDTHQLLIATLDDKYGTYGKIGLCLVALDTDVWTIKLLLMSCRVMSRGVGSVMIHFIREAARQKGVKLRAEFIHTDVNRIMYMTYKFAHFYETQREGDLVVFENDLSQAQSYPSYIKVDFKPVDWKCPGAHEKTDHSAA